MIEALKEIILTIVAVGSLAFFATFFMLISPYKKEIWSTVKFEDENEGNINKDKID